MIKILLQNFEVGAFAAMHAVCGRSGKTYGFSVWRPERSCHVFEMRIEEWRKSAVDIVRNAHMPGQLWIVDAIETVEGAPLVAASTQADLEARGLTGHLDATQMMAVLDAQEDDPVARSPRYTELMVLSRPMLLPMLAHLSQEERRWLSDKDKLVRAILQHEADASAAMADGKLQMANEEVSEAAVS